MMIRIYLDKAEDGYRCAVCSNLAQDGYEVVGVEDERRFYCELVPIYVCNNEACIRDVANVGRNAEIVWPWEWGGGHEGSGG